jgi:hypothetical protein
MTQMVESKDTSAIGDAVMKYDSSLPAPDLMKQVHEQSGEKVTSKEPP